MNTTVSAAVLCLLLSLPSASLALEGYYVPGEEGIQFRRVVEKLEDREPRDEWEEMFDLKNRRFFVSRKTEIAETDIEKVFMEKPYWSQDHVIFVFFKDGTREKIRGVTERIVGNRLGIIRYGRIVTTPLAAEANQGVSRTCTTGTSCLWAAEGVFRILPLSAKEAEWFADGLVLEEALSEEYKDERAKYYQSHLREKLEKNPDDTISKMNLAMAYTHGRLKDYEKGAVIFEELLAADPTKGELYSNLAVCYYYLQEFDKTIQMLEKAIRAEPDDEWYLRKQMGIVYRTQGKIEKAILQFEKSIKHLKSTEQPNKGKLLEMLEGQLDELRTIVEYERPS
jgi:hypothetical protein